MAETDVSQELEFVCPECAETITVNQSMRDAILEHGCVICGTAVDDGAFEQS